MRKIKYADWIPGRIEKTEDSFDTIPGTNCYSEEFIHDGYFLEFVTMKTKTTTTYSGLGHSHPDYNHYYETKAIIQKEAGTITLIGLEGIKFVDNI